MLPRPDLPRDPPSSSAGRSACASRGPGTGTAFRPLGRRGLLYPFVLAAGSRGAWGGQSSRGHWESLDPAWEHSQPESKGQRRTHSATPRDKLADDPRLARRPRRRRAAGTDWSGDARGPGRSRAGAGRGRAGHRRADCRIQAPGTHSSNRPGAPGWVISSRSRLVTYLRFGRREDSGRGGAGRGAAGPAANPRKLRDEGSTRAGPARQSVTGVLGLPRPVSCTPCERQGHPA